MSRATKEQTEARVNDLLRILLDGAEPVWDLCEFVREMEQTPGSNWHIGEGENPLSYSQIRRYAEKAEERIVKSVRTSRKRLLRLHLAKRRSLHAKAVSQGDIRAALACLDSEARLLGLFPDDAPKAGKDGPNFTLNITEVIVRRDPAAIGHANQQEVLSNGSPRTIAAVTGPDNRTSPGTAGVP